MRVLLKVKKLHHGVLRQLPGVGVGYVGVAGAGKHVAPVLPPGVDASLLDLQQQALLDAPQDSLGVFNLYKTVIIGLLALQSFSFCLSLICILPQFRMSNFNYTF